MRTLLTVFIISIYSFGAHAKTTQFVCDDWDRYTGTLFIGKKTDNGYIIRNEYKTKLELVYLGEDSYEGVRLYVSKHPVLKTEVTSVFAVHHSKTTGGYDFIIKRFNYADTPNTTRCNYE